MSYHQIILTDKDNDESNNLSTQTMIEINHPPEQEVEIDSNRVGKYHLLIFIF